MLNLRIGHFQIVLSILWNVRNANFQPSFQSFTCHNNDTISLDLFCDGNRDCSDGSDEMYRAVSEDPLAPWQRCINPLNRFARACLASRRQICDKWVECSNLNPCDLKCEGHYKCQKSGECVRRSTVCNQNGCDGCPEDHEWINGHGFKCFRNDKECVLPQQLLHDDVSDCYGGIDLCFGLVTPLNASSRNERQPLENLLRDRCFQCLDDAMIIPTLRVCDGVIDCPDLSDECLCEREKPDICNQVVKYGQKVKETSSNSVRSGDNGVESQQPVFAASTPECDTGSVKCENGTCIARSSICDGVKDCQDDERHDYCRGTINCRDATRFEEVCRCDFYRDICRTNFGAACNGVADCQRSVPGGLTIIAGGNTYPEDECRAFCLNESSNFTCIKWFSVAVSTGTSSEPCESATDFPNRNRTRIWPTSVVREKICDGIEDCELGNDEEDCPQRFRCDTFAPRLISIRIEQTCDGSKDCRDGSDEAKELCGDRRFYCPLLGGTKINIDQNYVCNFMINCDDGSDEKNCNDGRFYCENGRPLFVDESQKFDGRGDCTDWSDECPLLNRLASSNGFSSRYELIASTVLRAFVWIMGLLSICGNSFVLYYETKTLRNSPKSSPAAVANRLLILNLAASDIIMGVYLISIGIAGIVMQGRYCSQDLLWRSSSSCTALGILSVLSSECSVLTMIMLTSCRLYAVLQPFKSSSHPKKTTVCLMILSSWVISLTLALIPLVPSLSSIFVTHAQFEYEPYLRNQQTSLDDARNLFRDLLTYDLKLNVTIPGGFQASALSWSEMETFAKEYFVHEHFKIEKVFGYYSIDSVCIPKFFISRSERAWGLSFFVNLFNFFAFLFVASAYITIYVHSNKRANLRHLSQGKKIVQRASDLQRKILRLIITDFCCWVPICLISFAKLGGAKIENDVYVFAAIILLPINSALNPLLYSNLPDIIFKKFFVLLKYCNSSSSNAVTPRTVSGALHNRGTEKHAMELTEQPTSGSKNS